MELCIIQHQDKRVCASDRSLPLGDSPLIHTEPVPNNEVRVAEVICILDWEQEHRLCFPQKAHCAGSIPCTGHVLINPAAPHLHIQSWLFLRIPLMTEMTMIYPIWFQKSDPSTVAVGMDQGVVSISSPLTPELPSLS